jgi:hypothetical protein
VEIDPVVLLPVTLPPVIFSDIVVLSPVICATTELATLNPVIVRIAPERMTNIAKIAIVFVGYFEF